MNQRTALCNDFRSGALRMAIAAIFAGAVAVAPALFERLRKDPAALSAGITTIGGNNHVAYVKAARFAGIDALQYLDALHVELRDVLKELGLARKLD